MLMAEPVIDKFKEDNVNKVIIQTTKSTTENLEMAKQAKKTKFSGRFFLQGEHFLRTFYKHMFFYYFKNFSFFFLKIDI